MKKVLTPFEKAKGKQPASASAQALVAAPAPRGSRQSLPPLPESDDEEDDARASSSASPPVAEGSPVDEAAVAAAPAPPAAAAAAVAPVPADARAKIPVSKCVENTYEFIAPDTMNPGYVSFGMPPGCTGGKAKFTYTFD